MLLLAWAAVTGPSATSELTAVGSRCGTSVGADRYWPRLRPSLREQGRLRAEVDAFAARAFDAIFEALPTEELAEVLAGGAATGSLAEAFTRGFPPGSPLPAYLRRLLLTNDPAGAALFGRWFAATRRILEVMVEMGVARPSEDPAVRAAFFLVNDLALILLRNPIAIAIGADPLTPEGIERWAREGSIVYAEGAFIAPGKE